MSSRTESVDVKGNVRDQSAPDLLSEPAEPSEQKEIKQEPPDEEEEKQVEESVPQIAIKEEIVEEEEEPYEEGRVKLAHGKVKNLEWRLNCVRITFENQEFKQYTDFSLVQILYLLKKIHTLRFVECSLPEEVQNLMNGEEDTLDLRQKLMECQFECIDISLFKNYEKAVKIVELFPASVKVEINSVVLPVENEHFIKVVKKARAVTCLGDPVKIELILEWLEDPCLETLHVPVTGKFDPTKYVKEWKAGKRNITRWAFQYQEGELPKENTTVEYFRDSDTKILSVLGYPHQIVMDTDLDTSFL